MNEKLDRYQIVEEIGQGGFATVYRAHDTELDRQVAVKELKPILLQDKTWVKRFRREARAIAQLDHARIITVYDVIQPGERLLIVMRLVNGPNLDELLPHGAVSPGQRQLNISRPLPRGWIMPIRKTSCIET